MTTTETDIPFTRAGLIKLTKLGRAIDKHVSNLHRARLAGQLPCVKILGEWYVTRASWEAFLARTNGESTSPTTEPVGRTPAQRRRDDAAAARRCEELGV